MRIRNSILLISFSVIANSVGAEVNSSQCKSTIASLMQQNSYIDGGECQGSEVTVVYGESCQILYGKVIQGHLQVDSGFTPFNKFKRIKNVDTTMVSHDYSDLSSINGDYCRTICRSDSVGRYLLFTDRYILNVDRQINEVKKLYEIQVQKDSVIDSLSFYTLYYPLSVDCSKSKVELFYGEKVGSIILEGNTIQPNINNKYCVQFTSIPDKGLAKRFGNCRKVN